MILQMVLSWEDASNNEMGFAVERMEQGGTFQELDRVGPGVVEFVDDQILAGVTYTWRVRAFGEAGYSGYSNEFSYQIPDLPQSPKNLKGVFIGVS